MIFRPGLAAKVLNGTKTMTRRRLRRGGFPYSPGRWYKAQPGRGKFHICHIFVTKVRTQRLGDISDADALREGFESRNAFFLYWATMHRLDTNERVAVIEWVVFPAVKDCCARIEALGAATPADTSASP